MRTLVGTSFGEGGAKLHFWAMYGKRARGQKLTVCLQMSVMISGLPPRVKPRAHYPSSPSLVKIQRRKPSSKCDGELENVPVARGTHQGNPDPTRTAVLNLWVATPW